MTCPAEHFSLQKSPVANAAASFVYSKSGSPHHLLFWFLIIFFNLSCLLGKLRSLTPNSLADQ